MLYDPENPTDIRIAGFMGSGHMGGVVMIFIGVMFVLMGVGIGSIFLLGRMKPYVIRRLRPAAFVPLLGAGAIVAFVIAFDFGWWFAAAAVATRAVRGVARDARPARGRARAC